MIKTRHAALISAMASLGLSACGDQAQLPVSAGIGPNPELPPPNPTWIPTVNIAPGQGLARRRGAGPGAGLGR